MVPLVLSLSAADAPLEWVGGKGRSLWRLDRAGFPVPPAFLITTQAYRAFVAQYRLLPRISALLSSGEPAFAGIEALFTDNPLAGEMRHEIVEAFRVLGARSVAVRSSATAEDLPDHSFAGLQDTYLNIKGEEAVIAAVQRCWASLWSERVISYRAIMELAADDIAMAVVVQAMVDADASGVLFTANPVTGARDEVIVNACFGLGEALVGGDITPDSYVLDRPGLAITERKLASKPFEVIASAGAGTRRVAIVDSRQNRPSVSDTTLSALARMAVAVEEAVDNVPQDIEWVVAQDDCWLVQSRPITHLPPPPLRDVTWLPPPGCSMLFRRQVVENMPGPLSPLFEALYLWRLDRGLDDLCRHMELPVDLDDFIYRPLFVTVNGFGYIRYDIKRSWKSLRILPALFVWSIRNMPRLMRSLGSMWRETGLPEYRETIARWRAVDAGSAANETLIGGIDELAAADIHYWFYVSLVVGAAKITEEMLNRFLRLFARGRGLTPGRFLTGFESLTMQAQTALEQIASKIHADARLRDRVLSCPDVDLPALLLQSPVTGSALEQYLEQYGHQIFTLDFVEPTQGEDLLGLCANLKRLAIDDAGGELKARRDRLAAEKDSLVGETLSGFGPIRRWCFRKLLGWAETCAPYREQGLFYMGAAWPVLRHMALTLGGRLVADGKIELPGDVFFLKPAELVAATNVAVTGANGGSAEFAGLARDRRQLREARKRLHPPGRVPEDLRFKIGPFDLTNVLATWETQKQNEADTEILTGFGVSQGAVTGVASVVMSHAEFDDMLPGTILVCPTTTPAWTPLFAQALGLVTDIGAPLAHGSIIAREFGIPAVLGTGDATRRITSGQRISIDGTTGEVRLVAVAE